MTLKRCLTRGSQLLMLHRRFPPNQNEWNGVGGRLEPGETPVACIQREVREETGFIIRVYHYGGIVTWRGYSFTDTPMPPAGLYLFTADAPEGEPAPCSEGELAWKPLDWVLTAPGVVDNIPLFLPAVLAGAPPQEYHFEYRLETLRGHTFRPLPGWARIDGLAA